jgi:hypothetical protein
MWPSWAPQWWVNTTNIGWDSVVNQFESKINQIMIQSNDSWGAFLKWSALGRARETALYNLRAVRDQIVGAKITSSSEIARLELLLKEMESRMATEDPKSVLNYRQYEPEINWGRSPDGNWWYVRDPNWWFKRTAVNGRYGATKIEAKSFDPDDAGSPFGKLNDRQNELWDQVIVTEQVQARVMQYGEDAKEQDDLKGFYEEQNKILWGINSYKDMQEIIRWFQEKKAEASWKTDQRTAIRAQEEMIADLKTMRSGLAWEFESTRDQLIGRITTLETRLWSASWEVASSIRSDIRTLQWEINTINKEIFAQKEKLNADIAKATNDLIKIKSEELSAKKQTKEYEDMIAELQKSLKSPLNESDQKKSFIRSEIIKRWLQRHSDSINFDWTDDVLVNTVSAAWWYVSNSGYITHPKTLDDIIDENNDKIQWCIREKWRLNSLKAQAEWEYKKEKSKEDLIRARYEKAFNKHYGGKDKAMIEAVRWDLFATEKELASMKARQEWLRVLLNDWPEYIEQGMPTYEFDEDGVGHTTGQQTIRVPNPNGQSGVIIDRIRQIENNSRHDTIWWSLGSVVTWAAEWIGKLFGSGSSIRDAFNRGKNWTP